MSNSILNSTVTVSESKFFETTIDWLKSHKEVKGWSKSLGRDSYDSIHRGIPVYFYVDDKGILHELGKPKGNETRLMFKEITAYEVVKSDTIVETIDIEGVTYNKADVMKLLEALNNGDKS